MPLSTAYAEQVLWQSQVPRLDLPGDALPTSADAVVIGGGYAGMAAAFELAVTRSPGGRAGEGRDRLGRLDPQRRHGDTRTEGRARGARGRVRAVRSAALSGKVNEAFDHVETIVADDGIDCSYARTGQLLLAHTPRHVPDLKAMAREHGSELGEPVWFVPRDQLADEIGSTVYHGGLVLERTGGLQPAAFHRGLVERAL